MSELQRNPLRKIVSREDVIFGKWSDGEEVPATKESLECGHQRLSVKDFGKNHRKRRRCEQCGKENA